jgi:hypothetical protein
MISYHPDFADFEKAPLEYRAFSDYLKRWWRSRQVSMGRKNLERMLHANGISGCGKFLLKNLGLSLTEYYWIKPVNRNIKWADVNLFDNDFKENVMTSISDEIAPNSSIGGELEKSWIIKDGKRCLLKGNHGELSSESINEAIAAKLHEMQGYGNYTKYELIHIKEKPYDWGCLSQAFTSQELELVSANAVMTSEKCPEGRSRYEHLIKVAGHHGMDEKQFRRDLEYQILTDYVLSNTDRHMDNIGILRDAQTLKFIRMAPIFDTGRALGARGVVPYTEEEISSIEVNSFEPNEKKLLGLVRSIPDAVMTASEDPSGNSENSALLDLSKLPDPEMISEMYRKDTKISQRRIESVVHLYEKKKVLLSKAALL